MEIVMCVRLINKSNLSNQQKKCLPSHTEMRLTNYKKFLESGYIANINTKYGEQGGEKRGFLELQNYEEQLQKNDEDTLTFGMF